MSEAVPIAAEAPGRADEPDFIPANIWALSHIRLLE